MYLSPRPPSFAGKRRGVQRFAPLCEAATLYTHLFELGFSSVCELIGKRVFIRLLSVTGDSSLRSE